MDDFVATMPDTRRQHYENKMAPASPGSESAGEPQMEDTQVSELAQIRAELAQISTKMLTKADTGSLVQEIRAALRLELADMHSDLTALEQKGGRNGDNRPGLRGATQGDGGGGYQAGEHAPHATQASGEL
ncbi:Hypothetical predicted protein [Pelobates cultripes]|uniref:Uncharacterized protein n=1 Tax=Pelobates cultripes TaxID=61616 RepID=A0AAD1RJX3_PELCU|nr:Hypothetical predicted protein [Pelobates cultripes]